MPSADPPARPPQRRFRVLLLGLLALGALFLVPALSCFSAPRYEGPVSDHFDGREFRNLEPIEETGLLDIVRWRLSREGGAWEGYEAPIRDGAVVPRVEGTDLRVTFVGHATVLLQTAGLNILTDPHWSERSSPVSWAGPRRFGPPGIAFSDLPPIDVVVVSHNHYDHLDLPTLRRLAEEHAPTLYLPLGNTALLEREDIPGGRDLDWWERVELSPDLALTCVPAQHFSGRGLRDHNAALWGGFVLEGPGGAIYFAGDTGDGGHFEAIGERFGGIRLALLPIGAYEPRSLMSPVHIDPAQAARAHARIGARTSIGIHFGCFELTDEGPLEPVEELERAKTDQGIAPHAFWVMEAGEARDVPPY